jgi:8-amino-7-oxononanoate synthase
MDVVAAHLGEKLAARMAAGNLRSLPKRKAPVDFFSNDYLGFATTGILSDGLQHANARTGATGSRLLSGNSEQAELLEQTIAKAHGGEAALLFNSGYDANIGLLSCLGDRHTTFLYDELSHASIIDGLQLNRFARQYKFRHNNVNDLREKIERFQTDSKQIFVVTESVFSMDGDIAPLEAMTEIARAAGIALIIDEAHATGVFGRHGAGIVCDLGLERDVFARVHTFGKALGCHGAAVVGSDLLKQYLINFSRSFIYSTALPPHSVAAIAAAYELLNADGFSNIGLHELIGYFRAGVQQQNRGSHTRQWYWKDSVSPIQILVTPGNQDAKALAATLQNAGLEVRAILHPTVPKGEERIRVCLHSFNTKQEIDELLGMVTEAGN